jgi:hypothetical protein
MYFGLNDFGQMILPNLEKLNAFDPFFARRRMEAKNRAGNPNSLQMG